MNAIIVPVLLVMAVGFVLAVVLTIASKVFFVPVDETVANIENNNFKCSDLESSNVFICFLLLSFPNCE